MNEKMKKAAPLKRHKSGCPIAFGLDTFGDRWSLLIIRGMMIEGQRTYSDFLKAEEGIATNILIDRLKHLENADIVEKKRDPENRRSFVYNLTEKGRDLAPILIEIILWSGTHDQRDEALRDVFQDIQKDREAFEKKLRST